MWFFNVGLRLHPIFVNNFQTGLEIHGLHTSSKNQLFIPIANLTSVQKGITYYGIKYI